MLERFTEKSGSERAIYDREGDPSLTLGMTGMWLIMRRKKRRFATAFYSYCLVLK
jgi:hypothetical protein